MVIKQAYLCSVYSPVEDLKNLSDFLEVGMKIMAFRVTVMQFVSIPPFSYPRLNRTSVSDGKSEVICWDRNGMYEGGSETCASLRRLF